MTTDHGYTISSPMSFGSGELKSENIDHKIHPTLYPMYKLFPFKKNRGWVLGFDTIVMSIRMHKYSIFYGN